MKAIMHLVHRGSFYQCCVKSKQITSALTDCCPFRTREYRPRENVTFLENGTKVYALNPKTFVFVPEKSAGDPEVDLVRTINIPFVVRHGVTTKCVYLQQPVSQDPYISCVFILSHRSSGNTLQAIVLLVLL